MYILSDKNYEDDDLFSFQLDSTTITLYYSQLAKYSKNVRDEYLFSDVVKHFSQDIHKFKEEYQISADNIVYFFQLLQQNYIIKENTVLTYIQCVDLLKISKHLEVRKLYDQIKEYIKQHNVDVDFIIQIIQYDIQNSNPNSEIKISQEMENILSSKLSECLINDKFSELPISIVYRVIKQNSMKTDISNDLFNLIKKSIQKFNVLLEFIDLRKLTEKNVDELCEIYENSDELGREYFDYMKCNLSMIKEMRNHKKNLQEQLMSTEQTNSQQKAKMDDLEMKIIQLQKQSQQKAKMVNINLKCGVQRVETLLERELAHHQLLKAV